MAKLDRWRIQQYPYRWYGYKLFTGKPDDHDKLPANTDLGEQLRKPANEHGYYYCTSTVHSRIDLIKSDNML
jgi:hypothetical protein